MITVVEGGLRHRSVALKSDVFAPSFCGLKAGELCDQCATSANEDFGTNQSQPTRARTILRAASKPKRMEWGGRGKNRGEPEKRIAVRDLFIADTIAHSKH